MTNQPKSNQLTSENDRDLLALLDALKQFDKTHRLDNRFNFFEAVNMVRQETKHSRFLAFLLDPKGAHGLGHQFLSRFLSMVVAGHPSPELSRLKVAISDLRDAKVFCERDHFDITVELPSLGVILVVENKIDASESEEQLAGYRDKAVARYSALKFLGCFLTRDGYAGQDGSWGVMGYATVASELRSVLADCPLAQDVTTAIEHYVHLIEKEIVVTDELIQACKQIYLNHKTAIDLIIEHGVESPISQAFSDFFEANNGLTAESIRTNTAFFMFNNWNTKNWQLQAVKKYGWRFDCPVMLWFDLSKPKKLVLHLEVGPVQDNDKNLRSELVESLRNELNIKGSSTSTTFTRIVKYNVTIPEDPTQTELCDAMKSAFDQASLANINDKVISVMNKLTRQSVGSHG
ncbi:MAG: PD-(D/E)XK nuclease family protein [Proteobacteria bacterium]|nr:PD-(D/E)XK nuclease family protein [Pseudomonadota bacterium]